MKLLITQFSNFGFLKKISLITSIYPFSNQRNQSREHKPKFLGIFGFTLTMMMHFYVLFFKQMCPPPLYRYSWGCRALTSECIHDSDCVRGSCCHPTTCVPRMAPQPPETERIWFSFFLLFCVFDFLQKLCFFCRFLEGFAFNNNYYLCGFCSCVLIMYVFLINNNYNNYIFLKF